MIPGVLLGFQVYLPAVLSAAVRHGTGCAWGALAEPRRENERTAQNMVHQKVVECCQQNVKTYQSYTFMIIQNISSNAKECFHLHLATNIVCIPNRSLQVLTWGISGHLLWGGVFVLSASSSGPMLTPEPCPRSFEHMAYPNATLGPNPMEGSDPHMEGSGVSNP